MKSRLSSTPIFIFLFFVVFGFSSIEISAQTNGSSSSIESILDQYGRVKPGMSGSFDPRGFQMTYGPNGEPRFTKDVGVAISQNPSVKMQVPSIASNTDLVASTVTSDSNFSLSGPNNAVKAIAISGSDIYIGGLFTTVNGIPANRVAKWDGVTWSTLGSGMDSTVTSLAVYGSDVYVAGSFTVAGGVPANRIAKWDGTNWSALGSGLNGGVGAIVISGSDLFVGGAFTSAGGVSANDVAKLSLLTGTWSALGSGLGGSVSFADTLAVSGGNLYVGGIFFTAGGVAARNIARWNGSEWSPLGQGFTGQVRTILATETAVYAGGAFSISGGDSFDFVAMWDGNTWSSLGSGVNGTVFGLATLEGDVYVGGFFTVAGGVSANNVAKWNGTAWSALGSGLNNSLTTLTASGTSVYGGGDFLVGNGVTSNHIARWDGSSWYGVGCGVSLSPATQNFSNVGGNGTVSISTDPDCRWTATSNLSWASISGTGAGTGNGSIGLNVSPNLGPARTGSLTIAETSYTVSQSSGCSFGVSPSSPQSVVHTAGSFSVSVTASSQNCPWTSSSNSSWITLSSGASGVGDGATGLSIAANTGPPRTGNVTIGGNTYLINQLSNCSYSLSSSSASSGASGTSGSFSINTLPGCTWNATSNVPWITVTSGQSGSGSGNVDFTISANTGPARTGLIMGADQTFTVTQVSGCSSAVFSPTSTNFQFSGGFGGFSLTITSECPWTASSQDNWITVVSGTGTGNGSVGFQVSSNNGGSRSGTISVGATTFIVNQAASPTGSVAGRVLYFFGQNPVAVPGVTLSALGSRNLNTTTGSSGIFNIENFGSGAYTLTPQKTGGAGSAISATDASSVAQYSVGLIQLTPNQIIAADVSGDGTVSALDASRIAQFSVGLTLPAGDLTGSWKFTPSSRSYTSVTEALTGQDFTAILMGDVTGNWAPPPSLVGQSVSVSEQMSLMSAFGFSLSPIELGKPGIRSRWAEFGGRKNLGGDVIEIPISIADAMSILAYDAVISYDPDVLEPVLDRPIESNGTLSTNFNIVANRSEPGKIRLAAYGIAPVTGNGDLLILRFRVKKPGAKIEDANLRFESLMINEKSVIAPVLSKK